MKPQLLILMALLLSVSLWGDVPHTMNYKGKITTSDGTALNGTDTLAFDIYDVSSGGSPLWGETLTVNIVNGLFDVQLGHIHELDLDFSVPYWMQLSISTDGGTTWEVFDTREELAPVSYAYRAIYADTADYAEGSSSGVPSQAYVAFPDSSPRTGWTYTGCYEKKCSGDSWDTKASMPTARGALAAVAVNGKIYAIGGQYSDGSNIYYLSTNEEYDPSTDSWTTKASMPTARSVLAAAAVNGKIYAIGGYRPSSYLSTNEEYDPSTDSWTTKASMPTARPYLAAAAVNGKIYAIGGHNGSSLSTNEEYNPSTDSWTTKASMPTERYGLAAAAVNNKIYAIGGQNGSGYLSTNEEYDPSIDSWTTKEPMPMARYYLAAATVNNKIYAIGGYNDISTNEEYTPDGPTFYWFQKD